MEEKKADNQTMQKKKGVDFCGTKDYCYIIRSDLGCYMKAKDFHKGSDLSIHALHPSCQHGDHYLADSKEFYIIKGDSYRRVTDLSKDTDSAVCILHPDCRGGDHYLSAKGKFYIIFPERNGENGKQIKQYRTTKELSASSVELHVINGSYKDGLYYWGDKNHFYFLTHTNWGVEYHKRKDHDKDVFTAVSSLHPMS
ncbi:uncharacterized protein LOC143706053 [Siphateles boraxobius]|uniref:uncharacterized protein LOC143706053 n=1 Tax=Siphateles boraxobius TaxID=180520 RepID=UPI0040644C0E